MGLAVVTVAAGGLPVVESTAGGTPVTEASNGYGVAVTKVVGKPGLPVVFETIGVAVPIVYATLNGTPTNVTLSNGNLTATHSNTTGSSGARSTTSKTSGKFYFEATFNTAATAGDALGITQPASTYANLVNGQLSCVCFGSGIIYSNGSQFGGAGYTVGAITAASVISVAVDFDLGRLWFRRNGSIWHNQATADPATGILGIPLTSPGIGHVPAVGFTTGGSGNNVTMNFGATAFVYAVPAGFTSGWPA